MSGIRIEYVARKFSASSQALIDTSNAIITEYQQQGYDLTLRQLYYQHVARGHIANKLTEYKRLGSIVNDARLAGMMDWDAIVDRTRNLAGNSHWSTPESIVEACAEQFQIDKWADQYYRPEVWVEKEALAGVVARVAQRLDVDYFSCRGYVSQSEAWNAARRFQKRDRSGQTPLIIHLGDHDPSGIDMTRDIRDRMAMFGIPLTVTRIALNMDQVDQYSPPPNPAKLTDSRVGGYLANFGDESWELDALDPATLANLIEEAVLSHRDQDLWDAAVEREQQSRRELKAIASNWSDAVQMVGEWEDEE